MSNREPSLQELLISSFEHYMGNVYTAIPCVVIATRNEGRGAMVDIQPTINQKFVDGKVSPRIPILGVPVSFPTSSNAGILFPIKVGTTGLAVFSMRSIESWKSSDGRGVTPTNQGKFDKSDAIFIPGIQPEHLSNTIPNKHTWEHSPDDVVVFNNLGTEAENEVRLKPSGDIVVNTNQNVTVNCNNAVVNANENISMDCNTFSLSANSANWNVTNTSWNGNLDGTGTFTFNGIVFNTHRHGTSLPPNN